ncbi:MAG TPA: hypothetical protein ENK23_01340 [Sorangium sp.]|nr:hypothetical protein [Sorangium sp.]
MHARKLRVRCLPSLIPLRIEFDVTELDVHDVVKVSELTLPEGVEVLMEADRKLVVVAPPRVQAKSADEDKAAEGAEGADETKAADAAS